jgi:hypothetical protein
MNINLSSYTDGWYALVTALASRNKYVALDLSGSSVSNGEFDVGINGADTVKAKIVSLVLPDSATSIVGGSQTLRNGVYASLKTVSGANITTIGAQSFYGCPLTTASFPEVTSICGNDNYYDSGAFSYCIDLSTVSFPKLINIGAYAFSNCGYLTTVSFPNATTIGAYAFSSCWYLTTASFQEVTSIGNGAFIGCTYLTSVSLPKVTSIGVEAFYNCTSLTTVSFPEATNIDGRDDHYSGTFSYCTSLTSVSLPKVTSIKALAFYGCTSLTSVSIPKATSIGAEAFAASGRVALSITMGAAAPIVGTNTFSGINGSRTVTVRVPNGAPGYTAAWQNAFKGGNSYINLVVEEY